MIVGSELSGHTLETLLRLQVAEVTGAVIYNKMAEKETDEENKKTLLHMASEERAHALLLKRYTKVDAQPSSWHIWWYSFLGMLMGYTFVVKLLENDENVTAKEYLAMSRDVPELVHIMEQEQEHEEKLANMLDEERLKYVGAMVLGLNDALVELTGTIAGLTFALTNTRIVALAGIITGVSATLSMAASNYLAEKADGKDDALKSSLYTGVAYLVTVVFLVAPYLLLPDDMYVHALVMMLFIVILIIFFFNYYISVAKSLPFAKRFWEMACISLSVALISFAIGLLAKEMLGIDIG